ncbi:Spy0128 family protein, partial [Lachnospiraceae bacterium YH-ros2226]
MDETEKNYTTIKHKDIVRPVTNEEGQTLFGNPSTGKFAFKEIPYDSTKQGDLGDHYYVIHEVRSAVLQNAGIGYDPKEVRVHVTVSDKGDGTLKTEAAYSYVNTTDQSTGKLEGDQPVKFVNRYQPKSTELSLSGSKTLEGAELSKYADQFEFNLADDKGTIIRTAKLKMINNKG